MYFVMEMELTLMEISLFMEGILKYLVKEIEIMNLLTMMVISLYLMLIFWELDLREWNIFMLE